MQRRSRHLKTLLKAPLKALLCVVLATAMTGVTGCTNKPDTEQATLTVGLTYQPDIQFAPFYVAEANGYFADAGLDVVLRHHGSSEPLFGAFSAGQEQLVVAGGDEMYQARSQGVGIVAIGTMYQTYPVSLVFPATADGTTPKLLPGTSVGIPGPYGENWFYLKAVLQHLNMSESDIDIANIGYTQVAALQTERVEAIVGFINNDVLRLERAGFEVSLFRFGNGTANSAGGPPLVGASVGASDALVGEDSERLTSFIDAFRLGMQFCADFPEQAVEIAAEYVPGLNEQSNKDAALATLKATVALYGSNSQGFGTLDEATWESMAGFMVDAGLVTTAIPASEAYTTAFAGARPK